MFNNFESIYARGKGRLKHLFKPQRPFNTRHNIILHQYEAVYFHIPKVASTSLMAWAADRLDIPYNNKNDIHDLPFPSMPKDDVIKRYPKYFKFAFVRNPWDRMYSLYKEKIKDDATINNPWVKNGVERGLGGYGNLFYAAMPFTEFLEVITSIPDQKANEHFRSQYTFLYSNKGELLMNFVGRFEKFSEDFEKIKSLLNLEKEIPHLNAGQERQGRPYRQHYNKYNKQLIEQRFARDIAYFNYRF